MATSSLQLLHDLDAEMSTFLAITTPIWSATTTSARFLRAVDKLLATLPSLSPTSSPSPEILDFADSLLHKTMSRLAHEFSLLLDDNILPPTPTPTRTFSFACEEPDPDLDEVIPVARPIQDFNVIIDALSRSTIQDLGDIARRMSTAGYGKECADVYSTSRKEFVEESLARLGIRQSAAEEVHDMEVSELEIEIQRWNQAAKVVFLILFPSERRLADRVFVGMPPLADLGFADACRETAILMLEFAEAVAAGSRAPERLFKIVDMYEVLRDLLPEVQLVFADRYCGSLVEDYRACCDKLGETVRGIFTELEKLVRADPVRSPLPRGTVHPITRYVINYLHAAAVAWRTLDEIMQQEEEDVVVVEQQLRPSSSLSAQIGWIIERLNTNLEAKSRAYANQALSYVFLMNNGQYMVEKLGASELKHMVGEDWIRGQVGKIRHWLSGYQKRSWTKVVMAVQVGKTGGIGSVDILKQKLKLFNTYLEEICNEQREWTVMDDRLRQEIRGAVIGAVVPVYRSFLERGRRELRKDMSAHMKYTPEQVEARIRELFVPAQSR